MDNVIMCGSDHAGYTLKMLLLDHLTEKGFSWEDMGSFSKKNPVDYPDYAQDVARCIICHPQRKGLLICGSGIGMMIAANRFKGVRAALCHDVTTARLARSHNNANILVLGERLVGVSVAYDIVDIFMQTVFEGGRHEHRLEKIEAYEPFTNL